MLAAAVLLIGCARTTPRVVKIGLVAPFEGRYRDLGYEIIPAARLAIREYAEQNGQKNVRIELVAYDDAGDPEQAAEQARRLVIDPEVVIVIGHWRDDSTRAALPVYSQAGLPLIAFSTQDVDESYNLAPSKSQLEEAAGAWLSAQNLTGTVLLGSQSDIIAGAGQFLESPTTSGSVLVGGPDWGLNQFYALTGRAADGVYFVTGAAEPGNRHTEYWTDERTLQFVAGFETSSLGTPPGLLSISAYEATWLAIGLATGSRLEASPLDASGFDRGRRLDAPIYLYRWQDSRRKFIEQLR